MALPSQGMMLSERPSGGSIAPAAGGANALSGAGSIGNYKGVMLCNRPFAGIAAAAKGGGESGGANAGKHAFVTGKVKSEVGFAGKSLQTEKLLRKRVKHETALTRHRKWLADLQLTKQALEEQYMEDLRKKEESKRRFAEREARMRQMTRELGDASEGKTYRNEEQGGKAWAIGLDDKDPGSVTTSHCCPSSVGDTEHQQVGDGKEVDVGSELEHGGETGSRIDPAELRAVEKRRKRDGKPCRPKWALTEAKAQVEDELKHEEELEDLLEFTRGLDFGRYIRDAEVQSMIDQVKRRIIELEGQPEVDEEGLGHDDENSDMDGSRGREDDALDETESRLQAKIMKLTNKNLLALGDDGGGGGAAASGNAHEEEDDNISVARTALSEGGRSVRSIHSTRSLAAVAERARVGIISSRGAGGGNGNGTAPARLEKGTSSPLNGESTDMPVNDIVVVTHQDDGGLRLGGKNTVSNLPYIRRNPAI